MNCLFFRSIMHRIQQLKQFIPKSTVIYYKKPLLIKKGEMQFLYDANGRKYLDMFAGIVTVSVGHCHPKINSALKDQLDKLWHTTSIYYTEPVLEYAEKLVARFPGHLKVCFFVNSGSEANDLALALARTHTGRFDILSMRNAYHGMTQSITGAINGNWKQPIPSGFGIMKAMAADPYSGPWGGKKCRDSPIQTKKNCSCEDDECKATENYMRQFEEVLQYDFPVSSGPAAVIAESIQGVGGTMQYTKHFLRRSFEAVKKRGGLTISDEVQTGFGRLGSHFWGFEAENTKPDIVTMAKGIGNGFPLGAVVTTEEIAASFGKALYFNTYGGNPLASVVGKTVLEVIEEEKLQDNCAVVGDYFLKELGSINSRFIGDVRGKGLMIGVELIDEDGKALKGERLANIFEGIKDRGVLIGKGGINGNVLRIKPPMCIRKTDVDICVSAIADTLKHEE
ncbi:aminotransferase, class III [Dictyocaulus viviparus]|uniref:Alanine--glyoxylate aminotransferase 2, mitochondrial n=1 Tax=Dictyocaulus viviparus TaxID=29172 RepID=A0A0D8Y4P2_DICVI|nr:aminotransferase, class III [Dictyocaulus viviparus]